MNEKQIGLVEHRKIVTLDEREALEALRAGVGAPPFAGIQIETSAPGQISSVRISWNIEAPKAEPPK
jgi:hypothetical protein